jgi:hypothetical protein
MGHQQKGIIKREAMPLFFRCLFIYHLPHIFHHSTIDDLWWFIQS